MHPTLPASALTYSPDLDAYFQRIGDEGPRAPTLPTLRRIITGHTRSIPFENLDILLGRGISLEPSALEQKLVHDRRGGYCFEQNGLLLQVLSALGFDVQPISARVRTQPDRSFIPNRTHLFLRVEIEGESWLADVGVGALTPTAPLRLELNSAQPTPHETRRIVAEGVWSGFESRSPDARLFHQALLGDRWQDICEFTLEEMHPCDRELGNWYTSTHPDSKFRQQLGVARATREGRLSLSNREFKRRDLDGQASKRMLNSEAELLDCLEEEFGLQLSAGTNLPWVKFD